MCSRYELNATGRAVAARFALTVPPPMPNRAEVRPTDPALVVLPGGDRRLVRWGLEVSWDKRPLINARAETLASRFKRLLGHRILIPATSWVEWRTEPDGRKTRFRLSLPEMFSFAGLLDGDRFVMVTGAPQPGIAHIHARMPAVLAPEAEQAWLAGEDFVPCTTEVTAALDAEPPVQGSLF